MKATSRGVAAHIAAAAVGGPRFDTSMTAEQRCATENGIWLCENCAKIIDTDVVRFTVDVLKEWKRKGEERARKALENPRIVNFGPDFADTFLLVVIQRSAPSLNRKPLPPGMVWRRAITIRPIQARRQLLDFSLPSMQNTGLIKPGTCLLIVSCQNQGTGIDEYVKIDIKFATSAIDRVEIESPEVFQLRGGGRPSSSYASFMIRELLPGEHLGARVLAGANIPFTATLSSQNRSESPEVFIFETLFGDDEMTPRPPNMQPLP